MCPCALVYCTVVLVVGACRALVCLVVEKPRVSVLRVLSDYVCNCECECPTQSHCGHQNCEMVGGTGNVSLRWP
eukprot:m.332657 g.332657  ORF g.332657 m.332657 type:complete len:74 (-) comp19778_c2_seq1:201-422(-)